MSAKAFESKSKNMPLGADYTPPTTSSSEFNSMRFLSSSVAGISGASSKSSSSSSSRNSNHMRKTQEPSPATQTSSYRPPHAYARMGPSNRADGMPPFCWKAFSKNRDKRGKIFSHAGQPDCFDFAWQAMPPLLKER